LAAGLEKISIHNEEKYIDNFATAKIWRVKKTLMKYKYKTGSQVGNGKLFHLCMMTHIKKKQFAYNSTRVLCTQFCVRRFNSFESEMSKE